jgi:hypothetical protein
MSSFHASLPDDAVEPLGFTPAAALTLLFDLPDVPARTPRSRARQWLTGFFNLNAAGGAAPRRKS